MTDQLIPSMRVRVGNRGNSRSYEGVWVTTVIIKKICPVCGGPRGDKYDGRIIEDGEYYYVDNWTNPCGHHDWFGDVLVEAGHYPSKDASRPRPVMFEVGNTDGEHGVLYVYSIPQYEWKPRMTIEECEAITTPEIWAWPEKTPVL